jgi:hypothetical protein
MIDLAQKHFVYLDLLKIIPQSKGAKFKKAIVI